MSFVRNAALRTVRPIHKRFRLEKVNLFLQLMGKEAVGTFLDVGGGLGISGEFVSVYKVFRHVVVVNLEPPRQNGTGHSMVHVMADGCRLPFASRSFDWVFSNAVIEHVGGWERQRAFANEIRRVAARGFFVTTPNKYFPIEPHTLCPLYQFLPISVQKRVVRFTPGYLREYAEINLLSAKQLQELFPGAEIKCVGCPLWGNSLVAMHKVS